MPTLIPSFKNVRPEELLSMMRYVSGLDYWPVPLRGNYPKLSNRVPTKEALAQSWQELLAGELNGSFGKLDAMPAFKDALLEFKQAKKPDLPQMIRYFNILLHSVYLYLIELTDTKFTGVTSKREKDKATKASRDLLKLIRAGTHFGAQGINQNYELTVKLEEFLHFLESASPARHTETLLERRFLKRVIYEFLIAYNDPFPHVLRHLYLLIYWPNGNKTDKDAIDRSIRDYVSEVRLEMERVKHAPFGSWYAEPN
jgi:hypothetical protein